MSFYPLNYSVFLKCFNTFRSLKDARRRAVETVLEVAGASERTEDEVYDTHVAKFDVMTKDMNECGAALNATLADQKIFFNDLTELSRIMNRIYAQNTNPEYWPNTTCAFTLGEVVGKYTEVMTTIHEIFR